MISALVSTQALGIGPSIYHIHVSKSKSFIKIQIRNMGLIYYKAAIDFFFEFTKVICFYSFFICVRNCKSFPTLLNTAVVGYSCSRIWFLTCLITIMLYWKRNIDVHCTSTSFFEPLIEHNFVHNKVALYYYTNPVLMYVCLFRLYVIMIGTCHALWGPYLEINSTKMFFSLDQMFFKFAVFHNWLRK